MVSLRNIPSGLVAFLAYSLSPLISGERFKVPQYIIATLVREVGI